MFLIQNRQSCEALMWNVSAVVTDWRSTEADTYEMHIIILSVFKIKNLWFNRESVGFLFWTNRLPFTWYEIDKRQSYIDKYKNPM